MTLYLGPSDYETGYPGWKLTSFLMKEDSQLKGIVIYSRDAKLTISSQESTQGAWHNFADGLPFARTY